MHIKIILMSMETIYIAPEANVLELYVEGVRCGSGGLDMDPEAGNM